MRGFWSDITDAIKNETTDAIESRIKQNYGTDHIKAQNETVQYFSEVLQNYESGRYSSSQAAQLIQRSADSFAAFAASFGARGQAGARDVSNLARQIITDLRSGIPTSGTAAVLRQGMPSVSLSSLPDWVLPAAVIGGVIYFATRPSRRIA